MYNSSRDQSPRDQAIARPAMCPSCHGKIIDTRATVISVNALWRCRECEHTWTIASLAHLAPRPLNR